MSQHLAEVLAAGSGRDYAPLLEAYRGRDRVPLPEVGAAVGMSARMRSNAVREGVIRPNGRAGVGGGYTVSWQDAALILFAAALAVAGGVAVVTILRGLVGAGVSGEIAAAALEDIAT